MTFPPPIKPKALPQQLNRGKAHSVLQSGRGDQ
jgi:hypothetical protein